MGYGRRYSREAEPQMAAPPRTDPIEHRATCSWPTRSADGNVALRGVRPAELPLRPPRWPLTGCAFSWKPHRGSPLEGQEHPTQDRGPNERDSRGSDGRGTECD